MSLASYQGWKVGAKRVPLTGPKVYRCVMDPSPYRWQQQQHQLRNHHHQTESMKGNVSSLSVHKQRTSSISSHCLSSAEPTSNSNVSESNGVVRSSSPLSSTILRGQEEFGPVSSYVLPGLAAYPGTERVPLFGVELEFPNSCLNSGSSGCPACSDGMNSQRSGRSGGHQKVHPHDHEDDDFTSCGQEVSKLVPITGGLPEVLAEDCLGALSTVTSSVLLQTCEGPDLSTSSSSIGVGGEHSLSDNDSEDNTADEEVQSALRTAPLRSLAALEDSLPIKRGLSRYYAGQSRSFGCLSDALSTSLAKPANPYARRRKNFVLLDDRQRTCPPVSRTSAAGISKKNSFGNRSNLALAVAMEAAQQDEDGYDNDFEEEAEEDNDRMTPLPRMGLGRLHDNSTMGPSRSYSLSDLQGAVPPTRAFSFSDLQGAGRD